MAGIWNQSQSQLYDQNGKPMAGARAFFYQAGTTTPLDIFQAFDLGLINKLPNPITTDGYGRWPNVFFDEADGFFRVRVTDAGGVVVFDTDGIPIIGPAGGGGGSVTPVDPDSVAKTGDLKARYGEGFLAGWVRGNGRTIGSATSGASERANNDTQPLFEFLWNADPNLVVVGGRGANSAADWAANKQLTIPDFRGRTIVGLDVMGNIAANVIPSASALGWTGGASTHTLLQSEMPAHNHVINQDPHSHDTQFYLKPGGSISFGSGVGSMDPAHGTDPATVPLSMNNTGGGGAHNNLQPSLATTIYVRL